MQRGKKLTTLFLTALLAIGAVGCGSTTKDAADTNGAQGQGAAAEAKILRMAAQDPQVPLDAQKHTYSHLLKITDQIVEPLIIMGADGNLQPLLLTEMPKVSDDLLTYEFTLKENVKFHNGETLKASDVKYSFKRLLTDGKMGNLIDMIKGADKLVAKESDDLEGFQIVDDTHFTITINEPFIPFLSAIATDYVVIYPEAACTEAGDEWGLKTLVGTGPFRFDAYNQGQDVIVTKFEEYHGEPVKLDGINFKFIQDPNTQVMEYQKGNIDVLQLDSALYPTFANNEAIKEEMHSFTPYGLVFFTINTQKYPDPKVREALSYSIDREAICNDLLYGTATPAKTFIPKGLLGHNDEAADYEYNPEKAKQLLAEAGYPDGIEIEVQDNTKYPTYSKLIVAVQEQARASGINIKINQVDNAAWADMKRSGQVSMAISNWYVDYADPDGMIYQTMSEKMTKQNSNFYADEEFNQLLNDARGEADTQKRGEMYKKADELLTRRDYAAIPICNETMFYLAKDYVKGFEVTSSYRYYFGNADLEK